MTTQDEDGYSGEEKKREAIGGYLSPARHAAGDGTDDEPLGAAHHGQRNADREPGPAGDIDTRVQAAGEDGPGLSPSEEAGTEEMTAAEASGQVAYGAGDASGETGATGAESSSG